MAESKITEDKVGNQISSEVLDEKLHQDFVEYGNNAKLYVRKCLGLIPEIFHKQIHRKKGFQTIYDYARMLAGISDAQVKRILSLHANFKDKPVLRELLANGKVGISKLVTIASIATPENQAELARKVEILPRSALETFVNDVRKESRLVVQKMPLGQYFVSDFLSEKVLPMPQTSSPDFVPGDKTLIQNNFYKNQDLYLSEEVKNKLLELQHKGIDINELLAEILNEREQKLKAEKETLAAKIVEKKRLQELKNPQQVTSSRYIPVRVREIVQQEHGSKCSIDGCFKEAVELHHSQRFALGKSHDPRFLAPLCKNHHVIAHSIDRKYLQFKKTQVGSG